MVLDLIACIPVYNDWESVTVLLQRLDLEAEQLGLDMSILILDDGSTEPPPAHFPQFHNLRAVESLRLRRNLGHQRAIAVGLSFIHANRKARAVLVMDADGEDKPEDVKVLYGRCEELGFTHAVFAKRTRRTEGLVFRLGYISYKAIHLALTGVNVDVGNFSVLPWSCLEQIVVVSELWNHYAAGAALSKLAIEKVNCARGKRIMGQSKMNISSLILHGLRAISIYEQVGLRLLTGSFFLRLFAFIGLLIHGDFSLVLLAIPVLNNLLVVGVLFIFHALRLRSTAEFIPARDYEFFVAKQSKLA